MSKNEESLSVVDGGALLVERVAPKPGTFTLVMSDSMCFEAIESGRTLRLEFRPKTLRERVAMWRRRYGL